MQNNQAEMIDILRIEGIMAQGYGLNPKIVMRDKRLTPEAKAIYSYIASFAGAGSQAFPSRDIMLAELQMSKDRYYRHLKHLTDADYIRVELIKGKNGMFSKNLYTIVTLPNPVPNTTEPEAPAAEEVQSKEKTQSAGKQDRSKRTFKNLKGKKVSSVNELRQRLQIDQIKLSEPGKAELVEEVFLAIKDMDSSEQISVGGSIKKKEAIQELLNQLTADNIRLVTNTMSNNKKPLINRKSYLQTCIANSIFDIRKENQEAQMLIKEKEKEEAEQKEEENRQHEELNALYDQCPEIKELDDQLTEIVKKKSKALLSGSEVQLKAFSLEYDRLQQRRDTLYQQWAAKDLTMSLK